MDDDIDPGKVRAAWADDATPRRSALLREPAGGSRRRVPGGSSERELAERIAAIDAEIEAKLSDAWAARCGLADEPAERREFADEEEALSEAWLERMEVR